MSKPQEVEQTVTTQQTPSDKTAAEKPVVKKKSRAPLIIIGICGCLLLCVVIAIIVGLIYWFISKRSKEGPVYSKAPIINILEPTGSNWYASSTESINLSGLASDDEKKVSKVDWNVDGGSSGTATGTLKWETGNINLREGDNKITVKAYDQDGNTGSDSIFIVFNEGIVFTSDPTLNPDYIFKDDPPVEITVRSRIHANEGGTLASVILYEVDEKGEIQEEVGQMLDNGNTDNGDDIPSDGTYSYKGDFSSSVSDPRYFRVTAQLTGSSSSAMSGVAKLIVIDHMSQVALDEINNLNQQVNDLTNQLQQQGQSPAQIANQVNTLVGQQSGIAGHGVSEQGSGVWWVYENTCIPGGILITEPDVRGAGGGGTSEEIAFNSASLVSPAYAEESSDSDELNVESTKAIFLGPYSSDFGSIDDYYGAWQKVKESSCPECEITEKLDENVTVDDFKTLSNYGVIMIASHGDNWYGGLSGDDMCAAGLEQSQVIIYTKQKLTADNLSTYEADLMARRLAVGANGNLIILPSYIAAYNGNFPSSIVYVSTCRSLYNNTMASAFLGKNAEAYFGYDDYVLASYTYDAGSALFDSFMLDGSNAGEAYTYTINTAGSSDGQGADFLWVGSDTLTMGGKQFQNISFENADLSGWSNSGDARVITSLGPLAPTDGNFMAIISTGLGSVSDNASSIAQGVCTSSGGGTLQFDYNLISEEPMEYIYSEYDDRLEVFVVVDGNEQLILLQGVNNSTWQAVSGIDFAGGDSTTYQTGWKTFTYPLASVPQGANIEIKFQVSDVGDSVYDTAAIIDNVRVE